MMEKKLKASLSQNKISIFAMNFMYFLQLNQINFNSTLIKNQINKRNLEQK